MSTPANHRRAARQTWLAAAQFLGWLILLVAVFVFALAVRASAQSDVRRAGTRWTPELAERIARRASHYRLDPLLVLEVMRRESAFNPAAGSSKGAQGLMQLMPATAARFGVTDPLDPEQAITGGCRYLRYLSDRYGQQSTPIILAAYNAGEGSVDKYGGRIPPYPETVVYVNTILAAYRDALALRAQVLARASARSRGPKARPFETTRRAGARSMPTGGLPRVPQGATRSLRER